MRMNNGKATVILTAILSVLLLTSGGFADEIVMPTRGLCAHRGASGSCPENTLPAFREAIRLGAAMIEFDVQSTKDGRLVILHDATLDRTTDGTGPVNQKCFDEVRQLDAGSWKDKKFAGTQIPTLHETLSIMPRNVWLNIHVKGGSIDRALQSAEEVIAQKRTHQAFLACDDLKALAKVKQKYPEVMTLRFVDACHPPAMDEIVGNNAFVQMHASRDKDLTAEQVKPFLDGGVKVNFFWARDPEGLKHLFEVGVHFPLVDHLVPMTKEAKKLGIQPVKPLGVSN